MYLRILSLGVIVSALFGCASTPIEYKPITAYISNLSNTTIEMIYFQDCDAASNEWGVLVDQSLPSGKSIEIPLTHPCINLRAINRDGKEIGKQWRVKNTYPFSWYIR